MTLRNRLIRLAHDNPELRADLTPLLKTAAGWQREVHIYPRKGIVVFISVCPPGGMPMATWDAETNTLQKFLAANQTRVRPFGGTEPTTKQVGVFVFLHATLNDDREWLDEWGRVVYH
jgi:hypothetical protein